MIITTEEAERLADRVEGAIGIDEADTIRSLAAERDALVEERDKAHGYFSRCLRDLNSNIEPLPDLLGVCTQIDNALAGQKAENARLREALILTRIAVSHACEDSGRLLYTQDLARIDAALGEKE